MKSKLMILGETFYSLGGDLIFGVVNDEMFSLKLSAQLSLDMNCADFCVVIQRESNSAFHSAADLAFSA
ncbi:MAG TPA: hypothetical protein EYN66_09430, partial [Myxococcales bacterium]|nr:hypothetical protein [Myxococcales bacterium]